VYYKSTFDSTAESDIATLTYEKRYQ